METVQIVEVADVIEPLEPDEKALLETYEQTIEKGFDAIKLCLVEIHEHRLYREYGSFEKYCADRWGYSKSHAYQLIKNAKAVTEMSAIAEGDLPMPNESQARELARIPDPQTRTEVWREVVEEQEKPTAKAIREKIKASPTSAIPEPESNPKFFMGCSDDAVAPSEDWNSCLWETPTWLARAISDLLVKEETVILEPTAGTGKLVEAIAKSPYVEDIFACEILQERFEILVSRHYPNVYITPFLGDFLGLSLSCKVHAVVANPPFDLAIEVLGKSLSFLGDEGRCLFLLPIAFFQTQKRAQQFANLNAHIHAIYPIVGRVAYLRDGVPVNGRQCDDAVFDIRPGASAGVQFIWQ